MPRQGWKSGAKGLSEEESPAVFAGIITAAVAAFFMWDMWIRPWTAEEAQDKIEQCQKKELSYIVERVPNGPWKGRIDTVRCVLQDAAPQPEHGESDE